MWRLLVGVFLVTSGCGSVANPRSCLDGTCTSEEFPFCDVDGSFGDAPNTCIAVTCEPMVFAGCRTNKELRCNTTGTDYDQIVCPLGCQDGVGCRVCEPNETVCANGAVQTCDASGNVVQSEACPLGCFEAEARCRDIDPSNGLATYLDLVGTPPDVELVDVGINVTNGTIAGANGQVAVPSFLMAAPQNGVAIRVFVVGRALLKNVTVQGPTTLTAFGAHPAIAFVASGDVTIEGSIRITEYDQPAAGSFSSPTCAGEAGLRSSIGGGTQITGSGGGGHATAGADGGGISGVTGARAKGVASGSPTLVPLRGGCPSGWVSGGGAIQISTRGALHVLGTVNVHGGTADFEQDTVAGGGGGGGILLEGATIELGPQAKLIAKGGGGSAKFALASFSLDEAPSLGADCGQSTCGNGGNGATATLPAGPGVGLSFMAGQEQWTGGGGGGVGYVRINTPDTTYTKASSSVEAAVVTTGNLRTR